MATEILSTSSPLLPNEVFSDGDLVGNAQTFLTIEPNLTLEWDTSENQVVLVNETGQDVVYRGRAGYFCAGVNTSLAAAGTITQETGTTFFLTGSASVVIAASMNADGDTLFTNMFMSAPGGYSVIILALGRLDGRTVPWGTFKMVNMLN